ncbi:fimbrial protein [Klebsiella grimontii]|uniref:fimbrial protein n=1 Tax=Klebsiella grimontii TaxID=2058152 RepID=UPI00300D256C
MKLSMSAGHQNHVRLKVAGGLLALAAGLFSVQARALECGFTNIFTENISIPVVGLGIATAGEDIPVGKILYTANHNVTPRLTEYYCTAKTAQEIQDNPTMNAYNTVSVVSTPSGAAVSSGNEDVFPTNVPGIGVSFTITSSTPLASKFPSTWDRDNLIGFGTMTRQLSQLRAVEIKLIKTGPIAKGTQQVSGASFPTFQISSGSRYPVVDHHVFVNLSFNGVTTVHTKTCQLATSDIEVNLGNHEVNSFDGPGKSTEWKNFDIILQGCPPFYGYGNYEFTENTGNLTGSNTDNVASIVFRSANGVVEGNPLLARLDSSVNAATGVGIELSRRDISESIAMDGSGGFNLPNLPREDNATYTIPLKARYVQTDTMVKPGLANGSVVFTITYL